MCGSRVRVPHGSPTFVPALHFSAVERRPPHERHVVPQRGNARAVPSSRVLQEARKREPPYLTRRHSVRRFFTKTMNPMPLCLDSISGGGRMRCSPSKARWTFGLVFRASFMVLCSRNQDKLIVVWFSSSLSSVLPCTLKRSRSLVLLLRGVQPHPEAAA
jgi:hypothetical protein